MAQWKAGDILAYEGVYEIQYGDSHGNIEKTEELRPAFSFYEVLEKPEGKGVLCKPIYGEPLKDLEETGEYDIVKCVVKPCMRQGKYDFKDQKPTEFQGEKFNLLSFYDSEKVYTTFRYDGDDDWGASLL
jgi:hypothetical protein